MSKLHVRAVFVSDVHLGTRDCQLAQFTAFLEQVECESLYLVGDIIDLWKARSGLYWPRESNRVLHLIMDKAQRGTRVVYIPGNHDEDLRDCAGASLNGVEVLAEAIHVTASGKRFLLLHGDAFDGAVKHTGILQAIGSGAYDGLMVVNRWQNRVRRKLRLRQWSLALYIKEKLNQAVAYIESFQHAAVHEARKRGVDGIVCGHIHKAAHTEIDGITYVNTGDWVEHCSAVAEDYSGRLHLLFWDEQGAAGLCDSYDPAPQRAAA